METVYKSAQADPAFREELAWYRRQYIGGPTPLHHAKRLSDEVGGAQVPVQNLFFLRSSLCTLTGASTMNTHVALCKSLVVWSALSVHVAESRMYLMIVVTSPCLDISLGRIRRNEEGGAPRLSADGKPHCSYKLSGILPNHHGIAFSGHSSYS